MYKAKFAFSGQEGEMTLQKDDLVELVEKDDNGWWLVKKGGVEGWAPFNYLELVPPKPKAVAPPPPPPPPPAAARPIPAAPKAPAAPKITPQSVAANASAKPVAVFPGMTPSNGSATPWKKATDDSSTDSRPSSMLGSGGRVPPPPPVGGKPKPAPPPVGAKPGAPKVPGAKPAVPAAPRPPPAGGAKPAPPKVSGGGRAAPAGIGGQLDLAAAVSTLRQVLWVSFLLMLTDFRLYSWRSVRKRYLKIPHERT